MIHENRRRARSFGDDAVQYDRSRPSYPDAMIDDLVRDYGNRVLDVGCGTGIATRQFRDRGCTVLGVEADARMAGVAQGHGLEVDVARFEDWTPRNAPFDLVVSGQAWHWVHPAAGARKAADVLRGGGALAAFWHTYHYEPSFHDAVLAVYHEVAPDLAEGSVALGTIAEAEVGEGRESDLDALEATERFDPIIERSYASRRRCTGAEWIDELATHSSHRVADPDVLSTVFERLAHVVKGFEDAVEIRLTTELVLAIRT